MFQRIAAGTMKAHPAVKVARDARLDCIRIAAHLGATHSSDGADRRGGFGHLQDKVSVRLELVPDAVAHRF